MKQEVVGAPLLCLRSANSIFWLHFYRQLIVVHDKVVVDV